jgi:hypothetical protein
MDAQKVFEEFCKEVFPGEEITIDVKKNVDEFETFYPEIVKIIQKDNSFFDTERIVFGRNLSAIENRDVIWNNLVACLFASFLHGDIKKKADKVIGIIKNVWNASGQENDEITKILNDEASQSKFEEIIQFILESRIAKIFKNLMESIDVSEFEINIETPEQLIEMIKNPEHPTVKGMMGKIQKIIEDKVKRGEINQQVIIQEVETIKAKAIGLFGNIFNEALGGRHADVPAAVLMGNTPEARRQRMIARMQRKLHDKNSR